MDSTLPIILLLGAAAFAVFLWVRLPQLIAGRKGRFILLFALLIMPILMIQVGVTKGLHDSKKKEFCTSCHEMQTYDLSLQIDDNEYLPAVHYQNHLVPEATACYTCHTDYTLYGDVAAKFNGLKHVWVHYFGEVPEPGEIKLYNPYPNDNCLQCHRGARRFEKKASHTTDGVTLELLYTNQKSCLSAGCHDKIHDIKHLGERDLWGEPHFPLPESLKAKAAPTAADPFAEPAEEEGGAKDPFADEPDAGKKAIDGATPAQNVNPDELWGDEDATHAGPNDAGPSDAGPAPTDADVKPAPDTLKPAPSAPPVPSPPSGDSK